MARDGFLPYLGMGKARFGAGAEGLSMKRRIKLLVAVMLAAALLPVTAAEARRDGEEFAGVANVKSLNITCPRNDGDRGTSPVRLKIKVTRKTKGVKSELLGDDDGWGDRGHIKAVFPGGSLILHRFETFYSFPRGFRFPRPDNGRKTFEIRLVPFKRTHGKYRRVGDDEARIIIKLRCVRPPS
jgi:hypothetical protein